MQIHLEIPGPLFRKGDNCRWRPLLDDDTHADWRCEIVSVNMSGEWLYDGENSFANSNAGGYIIVLLNEFGEHTGSPIQIDIGVFESEATLGEQGAAGFEFGHDPTRPRRADL